MLAFIMIAALTAYIALSLGLLYRYRKHIFWKPAGDGVGIRDDLKLALSLKRLLNVLLVATLIALLAWVPAVIGISISQSNQPNWGVDVGVYSGIKVDLDQLPGLSASGLREPTIRGKALMRIDTANLVAWYSWSAITVLSGLVALYALVQFRCMVVSLLYGQSITADNSRRLRNLGSVLVVWHIVLPIIQYISSTVVLKSVSFSSPAIQLRSAMDVNTTMIVIAIALILLSGVIQEAASIREEHQLTV